MELTTVLHVVLSESRANTVPEPCGVPARAPDEPRARAESPRARED
jgi:hypothetical protein